MGPQLRPRAMQQQQQQHRSAETVGIGEFGVPHGDAVRAKTMEETRKASSGEFGVPHGDAVRANNVAAPAAYSAAAADEGPYGLCTASENRILMNFKIRLV